jgi:CTP:molybdopterin cytidylyltransferase MocA
MIAATVLAAGDSSRMGFPKALLKYRGRTFLQTILDSAAALGLMPLAVFADGADNILRNHDLRTVTVLTNREPEAGPIGSIRESVRAVLSHPVDALLVWPIDFPHVAVQTVQGLIDGFRESGKPIVVPICNARRGHPALFGRAVFADLLNAPDSVGAQAVVRADAGRVLQIPVDDPAVLDSLNTPDAYRDLLRRGDESR